MHKEDVDYEDDGDEEANDDGFMMIFVFHFYINNKCKLPFFLSIIMKLLDESQSWNKLSVQQSRPILLQTHVS